jgi:iron complex outermembrane receptor protein
MLPYTAYKATFNGTQPMAAIAFKLTPDINLYARVARGFKSGGFSSEVADPRVNTPFLPQKSTTTEIGAKTELFGGRARVNVALFQNKIKDQHITQLLPGTTQSLVTNAGASTYKGAELEAQVVVTEGWRVGLNWGYLDPKFDRYIDNSFAPGRPLIDTASNRLAPYAAKNTINANLDGRLLKTSFGALRLLLDYTSISKMYLYAVNKSLSAPNAGGSYVASLDGIPATKNLNARLLLSDVAVGGGTADFSIFVKNVTDEDKQIQGIDFSMFRNGAWQEPRTWMFTANYKW